MQRRFAPARFAKTSRRLLISIGIVALAVSGVETADSAPIAPIAHDDAYATPLNTALVVPGSGVLSNDFSNGGSLKVQRVTSPQGGALKLNPRGTVTYMPPRGFTGRVWFTYRAYKGYWTRPVRSELARVTIAVGEQSLDRKIGLATDVFPRNGILERTGEAAIGNIQADAMRSIYGTQLALTNGGGIRSPLPSSYIPTVGGLDRTAPPPFDLVAGDAFVVNPFGTRVVTRKVTGAELWNALENGVIGLGGVGCASVGGFPQISGFRFTFSCGAPIGTRVVDVTLADGTPIPADATAYSIAINELIAAGGDGYSMFNDGRGLARDLQANVLIDYIETLGAVSPVLDGRIVNFDVCRAPSGLASIALC